MKPGLPQQALAGIIVVIAVIGTLIGGLILALGETGRGQAARATATPYRIPTLAPTDEEDSPTQVVTASPDVTVVSIPTSTLDPDKDTTTPTTRTRTPMPDNAACDIPEGWVAYTVQPGDSLYSIAMRYGETSDSILEGNCLGNRTVKEGEVIYLPPVTPRASSNSLPTPVPTTGTYTPSPTPSPGPTGTQTATDGACTNLDSVITSPTVGTILTDVVEFVGSAKVPDFDYYKLEIRQEGYTTAEDYVTFFTGEQQVVNGVLAELNTLAFPDGEYWVRLVVVNDTGNYPERCAILYTIQN